MHDHAIEQISHTIINNIATISSEWMNSLRQRVIYVIRQRCKSQSPFGNSHYDDFIFEFSHLIGCKSHFINTIFE